MTPPIPPGCEAFGANPEPYFDLVPYGASCRNEDGDTSDGPLLSDPGALRPIIAAVAEIAWLKEAERLEKARFDPGADYDEMLRMADGAEYVAREWRKWGEANG